MTELLFKILSKVGITSNQDKILHFGTGFVIAVVLSIVVSPLVGLIAGVIVGVGKELDDQYKYGGFDFFDMFATIAGTALAVLLYGLIEGLI